MTVGVTLELPPTLNSGLLPIINSVADFDRKRTRNALEGAVGEGDDRQFTRFEIYKAVSRQIYDKVAKRTPLTSLCRVWALAEHGAGANIGASMSANAKEMAAIQER